MRYQYGKARIWRMKMHANEKALGRSHSTADSASMTEFGDCVRTNLYWADGAEVYEIFDNRCEAIQNLARLGFAPA